MIKKRYEIYYIVLLCFLLTGCWDALDVNEKSIIYSVGIDGNDEQIKYYTEMSRISNNSNNEKQSEMSQTYVLKSSGRDFELARINLEAKDPNPSFLGATRIVVFSETYSKHGIKSYLNRIDGSPDYRKTVIPIISRESAEEFLNVEVKNSISVGFLVEEILKDLNQRGKVVYGNVGDILAIISQKTAGYLIPYFGIEDNTIKLLGYAVMKDSKYLGKIDLENSTGTLYLLAKHPLLTELIDTGQYEKNPISFVSHLKKRYISFEYEKNKLKINVELKINADLRYQYFISEIDEEEMKKLETILSNNIKKEVEKSIKDSQYKYKCDIYNFAKFFRAKNYKDYEKINWEEEFVEADVNVRVNTKITSTNFVDTEAKKEY